MVSTDLIKFEFQLSQTKQSKKNAHKVNQFQKVGIEMNIIGQKFGLE